MSYKDGIPLLSTLEDDPYEDDFDINLQVEKHCCKCNRRRMCLAAVLLLVVIVGATLAVCITLGFTLKGKNAGNEHPSEGGHGTGQTESMMVPGSLSEMSRTITPTPTTSAAVAPGPSATASMAVPVLTTSAVSVSPSRTVSNIVMSSTAVIQTPTTNTVLPVSSSTMATSPSTVASSVLPTSSFPLPSPTPLVPAADCMDDNIMCPSPKDGRTYKFVNLKSNGLRVVLISDPNTDLSGASMSVAAGSFNDPANYAGLAHFCEHMLFLGTEPYPGNNEYSHYLSTHGGYDNAFTSQQETNYHFRIQAEYLNQSLNMFAHFFIDPLFSEVYTEKEMNAVNQEHQKNFLLDEWKLWQLLKHVSNPDHPFSQFSTGSFETLNKTDIRDQLIQYYNASYSASTVSLGEEIVVRWEG